MTKFSARYILPLYVLSCCDFAITANLAESSAFGAWIEWNPWARSWMDVYGIAGLAGYKFFLVSTTVVIPLVVIAKRRPKLARFIGIGLIGFMLFTVVFLLGIWSVMGCSSSDWTVRSKHS